MLFSWGCSVADTWTLLWGFLEGPRVGEMEQQLFQQSAFVSNEPLALWFFEGGSKRRLRFLHRWERRWEDEGLEIRHYDKGKCFKDSDEMKLFFFTQPRCNGYLCHHPGLHSAEASTPAILSGQFMQTHLWKAYVIWIYHCGGASKTYCLRRMSLPMGRSEQNTRRKKQRPGKTKTCVRGGEPKPNNQGTWALI